MAKPTWPFSAWSGANPAWVNLRARASDRVFSSSTMRTFLAGVERGGGGGGATGGSDEVPTKDF